MNRSTWKGPYVDEKKINLIKSLEKINDTLTMPRHTKIFPKFLGLFVKIHNGKKLIELIVTEEMIGHRFGEFAHTRSTYIFKKKKKKKKKIN